MPALILLVLFRIAPVIEVFFDSFRNSRSEWAGFENYAFLLTSDSFINSIRVTLVFNLLINPIQIVMALAIALLIVDGAKKPGMWQTLNLLPVVVPLAVSSLIWSVGFRPDDGIINAILAAIGLPDQRWLTSADQAMMSIIILASWVGVGYWSLFLVAGLHQVPRDVIEAARLDHGGYWGTLWHVRLPLMRRPLAFVLVADTAVNLLLFAPVQILTRGGPVDSTNLVMFDIYRNAFVFADLPLAAAETVLLLLVVIAIVGLQFLMLNQQGAED
ncbi:carbohydrate ABC transporter permease [Oricola sp.]|uniref:carbohydrate ABC transporter permease n=1 Tax=Oricola sp. TaxID=1979950 RepID=UPI003BACAF2F